MSRNRVADSTCEMIDLFLAGALDAEQQAVFEHHAAVCEACAAALTEFNELAGDLALSAAAEPPEHLRGRLLDKIRSAAQPTAIVRRDEVPWAETPFPGVQVRRLFVDTATGNVSSMVRVRKGASYPAHFHAGLEHCYVLEGDLVFADHVLVAGDYEVASARTLHSPVTSRSGCVVLLINNVADELRSL